MWTLWQEREYELLSNGISLFKIAVNAAHSIEKGMPSGRKD